MFSLFRRRKPISLSLLERGPVSPDVAGVESAVSEPEQEKLAGAESNLVDLPLAVSEPDEPAAKSTPSEFAPSGAAVSNLYAIPNARLKFAIEQKVPEKTSAETRGDSDSPPPGNLAETPIATEGDVSAGEFFVNEEVVAATDASATQSVPEKTSTEAEGALESPAIEVLHQESVAKRETGAAEELLAVEKPVVAEDTPAGESPTERTPPELNSNLEPSAPEAPADEPIAPDWSDHVAESVTTEASVVIGESIAAEETPVVESNPAVAISLENPANELLIAESAVDLTSINSDAPVVASDSPSVDSSAPVAAEIESSSSEQVTLDLAHRLAVLEDTVRQQASVTPSKPKRGRWSFWRKRQPVEKAVAESSALENPVAEASGGTSAAEAIAPEEQVAAEALASTDPTVDAPPAETIVGESPASQISAAISSIESDVHDASDIELPPDAPLHLEAAGVEAQPEAPFTLDVAGTEPAAVEPQPEAITAAVAASEITVPENKAAEIAEVGNLPTSEESDAPENVQIESVASKTEQIALPLDAEPIDSTVAETVAETEIQEIPLTESGCAVPEPHDSIPMPAEALTEEAHAVLSKPKRKWWDFWRKPHPVEKSVAESSALENPVAGGVDEKSVTERIADAEQVAVEQSRVTESKNVDLSPEETLVDESPIAEIAAQLSSSEPEVHGAADIELPPDAPVPDEVAGIESLLETPFSLDVAGIEPAAAEPQPEEIPAAAAASEITPPEIQATVVSADGNLPATAESAAPQDVQIEPTSSETEQIALPLTGEPIDSTVAETVAEAGTAEILLTESVDAASLSREPIPAPAVSERSPLDLETVAEPALPEVSGQEDAIRTAAHDEPAGDGPVVEQEEVNASVSEVHEDSPSIVQSSDQSNHSSSGFLDLPRVAEPEVMDDSEEVEAYASATAQAWLDKIDDSFVEHAAQLVKGRQRGRALDIGTGPGQIALKLALRLSLWKVIGVDRSQKMIDEALAKLAVTAPVTGRLEFRVADGNRLEFPDATFDLVICNSVLHHFAEPRNLLAELARVTKRRGAILLRDLRRPSRLMYPFHVRWHGRNYEGAMGKLYRDSVRAAYTVPELQRLLDSSLLRGARVFRHGSTHIGFERPYTGREARCKSRFSVFSRRPCD